MTGIHPVIAKIRATEPVKRIGTIQRIMPTWLEADGPNVPVGTVCRIDRPAIKNDLLAEVIRVDQSGLALVPYSEVTGLSVGARIVATAGEARVPVGMGFLGRAVDALGNPIDGGDAITPDRFSKPNPDPPQPFERETTNDILTTGIRAIDGLLTMGRGQRVGIFAASGVGKTSLLSQMLRQVQADVCVTCLVGERGREVEAIWSRDLTANARKHSVLVAATSDQAAALRVRAVHQAIALACYWRDAGLSVFLVLDSVTRFAMALRELGLAAGEPPTVRAYTPSVFAIIPRVIEQCGALKSGGSITAAITVLSESDDVDDPLSELMKSLLDGHLLLSRTLAERGHFPAIDPLKSVSRNSGDLLDAAHRRAARKGLALMSRYESARSLIDAGLYSAGSNAEIDEAIARQPALDAYLQQELGERSSLPDTIEALTQAVGSAA
jgi:flagellum-specific ATP synthase